MTTSVYQQNGFDDRDDYLNSLREDYGDDLVTMLSDALGPNEDFDGLITELEDAIESGIYD